MTKMKYQRFAATRIEGFFWGHPNKPSESQVKAERKEVAEFVSRYWAERGEAARKSAAEKANRNKTQTYTKRLKEVKPVKSRKQSKNKQLLGTITATRMGSKIKIVLESRFETEHIRGTCYAVVIGSILVLRKYAVNNQPIDLLSDDTNEVIGNVMIKLSFIDECISNGTAVEKIYRY